MILYERMNRYGCSAHSPSYIFKPLRHMNIKCSDFHPPQFPDHGGNTKSPAYLFCNGTHICATPHRHFHEQNNALFLAHDIRSLISFIAISFIGGTTFSPHRARLYNGTPPRFTAEYTGTGKSSFPSIPESIFLTDPASIEWTAFFSMTFPPCRRYRLYATRYEPYTT